MPCPDIGGAIGGGAMGGGAIGGGAIGGGASCEVGGWLVSCVGGTAFGTAEMPVLGVCLGNSESKHSMHSRCISSALC